MAKKYSESFKANVVQKVREGKRAAAVAREVGASVFSVRQWVRLADEAVSERPMTPAEHAEIKRLRRELSEVKEERDILKKATAYFAKGQT